VYEQPVAERHASQAQLLLGHGLGHLSVSMLLWAVGITIN
jgi:hypothetical protein